MLNINDVKEEYLDKMLEIDLSEKSHNLMSALKGKFGTSCTENYFREASESRCEIRYKCAYTECSVCRREVIQFVQKNYIKKTNNIVSWR